MNHLSFIDRLLAEIKVRWPVERERKYHDRIKSARAFRESDSDYLRPADWSKDTQGMRNYMVDPLGERIPYVWSDLLFGEDPTIAPTKKADQVRMDELINVNKLPSMLQRAEWICSSEGEVWWRIVPDELLEHASIEWHSRLVAIPLWVGHHLMAVAFVSVLDTSGKDTLRYVEIHVKGHVRRFLFKAPENKLDTIGVEVALDSHPMTTEWDRDWAHGLDILAGRVVNKLGADTRMGISDYDGLEDLLLSLNELTTIGQENARLTAKQRAILPQRFLDMEGNLPRGLEILIATEVDQDPEKIKNQVAMVEFEFDAAALIAYTEHTTDKILTRGRVAPQLVGRHTEGAQTGPAMRARLLDSMLAAQGKGKAWDDEAPVAIHRAQQVEKLSQAKGGLGIKWGDISSPPSFKRASALPEDPESLSRSLAIEVNAEFLSRKTAIQIKHPEWDQLRVDDEVAQIMLETGANAPEPDDTGLDTPATRRVPGNNAPKPETGGERKERSNASAKV